jgi:hypothetical protein
MNMHCAVSCGVCKQACKDQHNDCPGWAKDGECLNNPAHTLKVCPTSCGVEPCKNSCEDKNTTACIIWALDDECNKNTEFMMANCASTCGVCQPVCEDKEADCQNWAVDGQCESNPDHMLTACPQSCGECQKLELFYKGYNGLADKEEL